MKHFSFLKNISIACLALATVTGLSSCGHPSSSEVAQTLRTSTTATVYSYNDTSTARNRQCKPAGPLPERAARALTTWLHYSTAKNFSYAYPQYFVAFTDKKGRRTVWGLCSDAHGNFVGVMIPRNGVPAWDVSYASSHIVYVCDKAHRKDLSEAIMDSLKGYDEFRLNARRSAGLTEYMYLISAPTDENAKRFAKFEEFKKQQAENKAKKAAAAADDASSDSGSELDLDSFGSDDDSDSFDSASSDSSSDDSSSDSSDDSSDDDSGDDEE